MDGVLNVLKPPGMTSFDVVAYIRNLLHIKKVGHTGTLDPQAAGVLPVCVGNAAKASGILTNTDKRYRVEIVFGFTTDTMDMEGKVTSVTDSFPDEESLRLAAEGFIGEYEQLPPMYSAVKVNGVRLYKLAREGKTAERKARTVHVHSMILRHFNGKDRAVFDVLCSKGTYIRTLCHDIGEKLGCGACMSFLLRTSSGGLEISGSETLEEIKAQACEGKLKLIPADQLMKGYRAVQLSSEEGAHRYMNGQIIEITAPTGAILYEFAAKKESEDENHYNNELRDGEIVRTYNRIGEFLGIGTVSIAGGKFLLKSDRLFKT